MKVKSRRRKKTIAGLGARILGAINSMDQYKFRSAPGLSQQTSIPLEHVEHYLVDLAQKGLISIGTDRKNILWAQLGKPREE